MKLLRVHLKEYADSMVYPTKRLLSKDDPDWTVEPREGEQRHGPYELAADYERQVVVCGADEIPFALVAFMRPAPIGLLESYIAEGSRGPSECDKCGEKFDSPQKLGGHKRHCKGRVQ